MPIRKLTCAVGEYYHLYNRGNSKQAIFLSEADYVRFSALLYLSNGTAAFEIREMELETILMFDRGVQQVAIGAYCLMPNHFHILLTPRVDSGVQRFMQKLTTGYSMYFNKRHHRTGALFEGRFKSQHADEDRYLKYLFSYIHLNPVKLYQSDWRQKGIHDVKGAMTYLKQYPHSSFLDNETVRPQRKILNQEAFPNYFSQISSQDAELIEWLSYA